MIQIDDAGSGSLIGGTLIGILRTETYEYYYEIIPVKCFTSPFFENKDYEYYCTDIIKRGFSFLDVSLDERIEICQGYIFEKVRIFLNQKGYNYFAVKIDEPLQSLIEKQFFKYAIELGIPEDYLVYTKYPFHFHRLLKWVFANYRDRVNICKTGWKSWKKHGHAKISTSYYYLCKPGYICLKCGKSIDVPTEITMLEFTTNKEYKIYLHKSCFIT